MVNIKSYCVAILFATLNCGLYFFDCGIPLHDVIASIAAAFIVIFVVRSPIKRRVTLEKNDSFKRFFPMLTLAEFTVFLAIPWAVLLFSYFGKAQDGWKKVACIISPHLYVVQAQIGLESVLMSSKRHGALFGLIATTNLFRGLAIAAGTIQYIAKRSELIISFSPKSMARLDVYMALSMVVYLMSNVVIVKLWYPLLRTDNGLIADGLRTFRDSVCVITGGASGIGKEMALELGNRGAHAIILMDMQVELAGEVATMLRYKRVETAVHKVDVRDYARLQKIVNDTKKKYGRLDYMINNAGVLVIGPIEKIGVENFDYIFDVNVRGVHNGVQAAYPIMKSQGFGHIVNVSSLLGLMPGGQWAVAYGASKHAVVGLSTNLRIEAANYGVRISCFCPGTVDTPIHTGGAFGKNLTGIPSDLWNAQVAKMNAMDAKTCASIALDKVANNEALFVVPFKPMLISRYLYRVCPSLWLYNKVSKIDWRKNLSKVSRQTNNN